jgi:hypothetical protein
MHWMSILVLVCGVGFASGKVSAAESDISVGPLLAKYAELGEQLRNNPFQRELYLESSQSSTHLKGEIYAVVDYPFAIVNGALNNPAHWCDVLILHINVKYCNASRRADGTVLTVNIGRKFFQPLEDAYRLDFNYRAVVTTPEYFALELNADEGPLSTHDYRIWIEAAALEDGRTFLHVTYAYEFGLIGRLAMQVSSSRTSLPLSQMLRGVVCKGHTNKKKSAAFYTALKNYSKFYNYAKSTSLFK